MRAALVAILLFSSLARAGEDRAAAKQHYTEGMKHYNLSDYQKARDEFRAAYLAFPDPSFLFNIGQCSRMLGEPEEAVKAYRSYLRESPNSPNHVAVEKFIADEEQEIQRRHANRAPTGAEPPKELGTAPPPTTTAPVTSEPVKPPPPPVPIYRKAWLWAVIAGAVVVAAGVALAVAFTTPNNAPDPTGTTGVATVQFH
jgi:tetratricopeptide (TPR) repeat protein